MLGRVGFGLLNIAYWYCLHIIKTAQYIISEPMVESLNSVLTLEGH